MARYEYVTLVDRALNDVERPREIFVDSQALTLKPGQIEVVVPRDVAMWLLRYSEAHHIHTKDGRYLCRFGVKEMPEDLLPYLGEEAADLSPLEHAFAPEGWNTGAVARPANMVTLTLAADPSAMSNQGGGGGRVVAGSAR